MSSPLKKIGYTFAGAFVVTSFFAGVVHYIHSSLQAMFIAETMTLGEELSKFQARIDALERAFDRLQTSIRQHRPAGYDRSDRDTNLNVRLERLEQQLVAMEELGPKVVDEPPSGQTLERWPKDKIFGPEHFTSASSLADVFSIDKSTSRWGEETVPRVKEAYLSEPWFNQYGGDIKTECRQSTCKVEWVVPKLEPDDQPFGLAELELMAAATRNADQVGRVETGRRIEDGQTIISVYLQRR
jgi:hypothetical protein